MAKRKPKPNAGHKRENFDRFRCRFSALQRAWLNSGLELKDLWKKAAIDKNVWYRLKTHQRVSGDVYRRLGRALNREATSLMITSEKALKTGDKREAFAHRLEQLIDDGTIPPILDGKPTDIVAYAWQLEDDTLDGISLTFRQQREAFRLLRNLGRLEELGPPLINGREAAIGAMQIVEVPLEEIHVALDERQEMAELTLEHLERDYHAATRPWYQYIADTFPSRLNAYLMAARVDDYRISRGGHNIEEVLESDMRCRLTFLRKYQEDRFKEIYRHSRRLIRAKMSHNSAEFFEWWPSMRNRNTEELQTMHDALFKQKGTNEPDFEAIRRAVKSNIHRTRSAISLLHASLRRAGDLGANI